MPQILTMQLQSQPQGLLPIHHQMTKVAKLVEHWVDQQFALLMEIFVSNVTVKEIKMLSLIQVIKQPILMIKLESMGGPM